MNGQNTRDLFPVILWFQFDETFWEKESFFFYDNDILRFFYLHLKFIE